MLCYVCTETVPIPPCRGWLNTPHVMLQNASANWAAFVGLIGACTTQFSSCQASHNEYHHSADANPQIAPSASARAHDVSRAAKYIVSNISLLSCFAASLSKGMPRRMNVSASPCDQPQDTVLYCNSLDCAAEKC